MLKNFGRGHMFFLEYLIILKFFSVINFNFFTSHNENIGNNNFPSLFKYVLELLGGQADALEIEEGAQIKLIEK